MKDCSKDRKANTQTRIQHISWSHNISEEDCIDYSSVHPSIDDVLRRVYALDSKEFPNVYLSLDVHGKMYPRMFLYGGPAGYALWLSEGDENGVCIQSLIMYIDQNKEGVADYQGIGQTYPGIEIEERHLTSNIDIVIEAVRYFAQTGKWNQKIPYIVSRIDEDGIEREYT